MIKKILPTVLFCFLVSIVAEAKDLTVVVKSTTNRGDVNIGDYWIGEDFAKGFQALGVNTDVDYRGEYLTKRENTPIVNLYMRGYTDFMAPFSLGCNVLYVYYPMAYHQASKLKISRKDLNLRSFMPQDANLDDDWQNYDVVAVASSSYAEELKQNGINAVYVPQFTNPEKFYPNPVDTLKTDILFVGSNWHDRTSLRYALESGFEVAVYGFNWGGIVPEKMYKAPYIENNALNKYYSSAKIVLNDHRPDMKEFGFVNNRVYDATAAGALVISDYMKEIEDEYGDAVPMYKNKEELAKLLEYYLNHEEERVHLAKKAQEITLKKFTNTAAAQTVLNTVAVDCSNTNKNMLAK